MQERIKEFELEYKSPDGYQYLLKGIKRNHDLDFGMIPENIRLTFSLFMVVDETRYYIGNFDLNFDTPTRKYSPVYNLDTTVREHYPHVIIKLDATFNESKYDW